MCGRFLLDTPYEELIERYEIVEDIRSSYEKKLEIFPSERVLALIQGEETLSAKWMTWGITATFRGNKKRVINGRLETAHEKKFFTRLKPCIIPSTGYYEWHQYTKEKKLIRTHESIFAFAGLYDVSTNEVLIMTCDSGEATRHIHHRMPAILKRNDETYWLASRFANIEHIQSTECIVEDDEENHQLSFF